MVGWGGGSGLVAAGSPDGVGGMVRVGLGFVTVFLSMSGSRLLGERTLKKSVDKNPNM